MRAVQIHGYGGPEVLSLDEIDKPVPGPKDVLVRVHATAVNPVDWKIRSGHHRGVLRYRLPWTLGLDVSGVVEAVGSQVERFEVGDEVWSSPTHARPGCYADYLCITASDVARKPHNLTHEEAASIPLVGLTAYQCLVEKGKLERGQTVLIHAGSGGVGSFAIQLAKHLGAEVVTTCSARNADFVRGLGADRVIDYTKQRFEDAVEGVDLVLDAIGEPAFEGNLAVLRRGGRLINITFNLGDHVERYGPTLGLLSLARTFTWLHTWPRLSRGIRARHVVKRCDGEQLASIATLIEQDHIKPIIDRVLPLEQIQEAHRYSQSQRARGKIVLRVAPESSA